MRISIEYFFCQVIFITYICDKNYVFMIAKCKRSDDPRDN